MRNRYIRGSYYYVILLYIIVTTRLLFPVLVLVQHPELCLQIQSGVNFFFPCIRDVFWPQHPKVLRPKHISNPDFEPS